MILFCAVIKRDIVSLLSFPCHIQVFLCAISPVCHLKYPYSCLSSHFCFQVFIVFLFDIMLALLLLATAIGFSLLFLVYFSYIDASMQSSILASRLLFLTHTVCLSSFVWRALCIIINFLAFFSSGISDLSSWRATTS